MTRYSYAGGAADFVFDVAPSGFLRLRPASLMVWADEFGGTRITDLQLDGAPITVVPVDDSGLVPAFEGPDDFEQDLWVATGPDKPRIRLSSNAGTQRAEAAADRAEEAAAQASEISGLDDVEGALEAADANPASPFRVAQDARHAATFALKGEGGSSAPSHAPLFVSTMEAAGSRLAAPGARTGLSSTTVTVTAGDGVAAAQGYVAENIATGVSGTKGAYTLTATDTTTLATLDGDGTKSWDAAVLNSDGQAITVTVLDVSGSTVTLRRALPITITAGQLASRIDTPTGQHLTTIGYKALAQHIAKADPIVGTRGGILEGQWDTTPPAYRTIWAKNAALTAYGVSNSAAPIVQSSLSTQITANTYDTADLLRRPNVNAGGVTVGCHLAGHGATATIRLGRRPVVVEFHSYAERTNTLVLTAARLRVTATAPDGTILYDETVDGGMRVHRIPVTGLDAVTIDVTNTDGAIYAMGLGQLTVREAGNGGALRPTKALLLGDSWTQFYDHRLGDDLADALGCEVATFGKGGTTTDWGIAWLDTALAQNPGCDTVILHFYTNDLNNNQSTTMTIPGGSTVAMWPNGLTFAQAQTRWIAQTQKLISMIQQRGLRPVVVLPGTVNIAGQLDAAIHAEQPRLIDWSASASELADPAAYVNVVGKSQGAAVRVGKSVRYASGPLAADTWANPAEDALVTIQRSTLTLSTYSAATGVTIGTDTNADGLSDGFVYQDTGTLTGDTYTPSIVGGRQRLASAWAASGATGQRRVRMNATVTSGREYLAIWDIVNATASQDITNSFSDLTGAATLITASNGGIAINGSGAGRVYYRATANASGSKYAAISRLRANGSSHTMDIQKAVVVDLTALFADAPNLSGFTTAQLVDFCLSLAA